MPKVSTDSSTITTNTLPTNYGQFYEDTNGKYVFFNINGSITSMKLGSDITATALNISNQTAGDTLYYNGSSWFRLAKGTSSQYLKGGDTPSWSTLYTQIQDIDVAPIGNVTINVGLNNWVDVTGASVSVTLAKTGSILAHFYSIVDPTAADAIVKLRIVYDSTAIYTSAGTTAGVTEGVGVAGIATSIAAGTYTVKVQGSQDQAANNILIQGGVLFVVAY